MGKRRDAATVVLSSDDEDARPPSRSYSKPKSRRPVTRSANPREPKKRRIPNPRQSSSLDTVKFPCEDFEDFFYGSKASSGEAKVEGVRVVSDRSGAQDLWVDKYRPRSLEELAVHKKKVEEVKSWVEERIQASQESWRNYVLIISGQAGVGKSVRQLSSRLHLCMVSECVNGGHRSQQYGKNICIIPILGYNIRPSWMSSSTSLKR